MYKKFCVYFLLYVLTIGIVVSIFTMAPVTHTSFPILRTIIIVFATTLLVKYFVYMLVSPWNDVLAAIQQYRQKKIGAANQYAPKVSVLVPAWNEEDGVVTTLETLLKSSYHNTEIIVINNASTDHTDQNIKAFISRYTASVEPNTPHIEIVYVKEKIAGKGYALNAGIRRATGDIIISIDADCSVSPTAIQNFVKYFADPNVMAAVGNVKIGNTENLIGIVQHLEFLFSFYFKKCDSIFGSIYIIGGAAGAFRREVLKSLHGFSVSNITEDIDLSLRIQRSGMKIVYAQDAIVYTEGAIDLKGLINQRIRWKRGRFETFFTYRDLFFSRKKKHNKILSWIILPLSIFGEIQLFLELFFVLFLFVYAYLSQDYSSFISGIIVVSSMFIVQIVSDESKAQKWKLLLLAPIGWVLLYVSSFVEFCALMKTISGYALGQEVTWQHWNRQGVFFAPHKAESTALIEKN